MPEDPQISWRSPKMREIEKQWHALHEAYSKSPELIPGDDGKTKYGNCQKLTRRLLRKHLSDQEVRQLATSCGSLPERVEEAGFTADVLAWLVRALVGVGDRERLVDLLSSRCPDWNSWPLHIEYYLAAEAKQLGDPVSILGDAFSKCKTAETRLALAAALRRALKGFGIRGNNDAEFVDKATKWHKEHQGELTLNTEYPRNEIAPDSHAYWRHPLFKWKSAASVSQSQHLSSQNRASAPRFRRLTLKEFTNSIDMKFKLIPAGEFLMGAPDGEKGRQEDEFPQHEVHITKPFWLGVYEVTQAEYEQVMGYHRSASHDAGVDRSGISRVDTRRFPVDSISWRQAFEFCNRLSQEEGFPPFYKLSAPDDESLRPEVKVLGGSGYRLPTEAEWEYACRAGTTTPYSFGETIQEDQAYINRLFPPSAGILSSAAVGSYPANSFGLYDMHGNVAEWCNDAYDYAYYEDCPIDDPQGPSADDLKKNHRGQNGVLRGGSWSNSLEQSRSACRLRVLGLGGIGFRVAKNNSAD